LHDLGREVTPMMTDERLDGKAADELDPEN